MKRTLLLVMSPYEKDPFLKNLEGLDLEPWFAPSAAEAERLLAQNPEIEVVVVDQDLLDGTWKDVVDVVAARGRPTSLLICTREVGDIDIVTASRQVHIPDVLIKEYDPKIVRDRISNALRPQGREPLEGASVPSHPATAE
jgi:DNA-binding response OmpR family regulator